MPTLEGRLRPCRRSAPRPLAVACAAILLALPAIAAPAAAERLPGRPLAWAEVAARPDGENLLRDELDRQRHHQARSRWVHELLDGRNISARSRRWLAPRGPLATAGDKQAADVDTLRIVLVRISFATNRLPHLVTMAPDGDFFLDPHDSADPLPIDPSPHDKAYFAAHLQGLAEYYRFQSGGRLHIDARVLPAGDRDSYQLSDVADYGPGTSGFWTLAGLERLVRDMIAAADLGTLADGSANLADYDDDSPLTYIIFAHAGSDWQSDIAQDTPNDIPTFFVTLGEPQVLASVNSVTGQPGRVSECSVIPETTSQDGYLGSIAAALYHEFGHALGLPDIYDATTGLTTCGVWDLMDSGTNLAAVIAYEDPPGSGQIAAAAVTGILPPSLSAWCRWFLGWLDVELVGGGPGREYKLPAAVVPRGQYTMHNTVPGNAFDAAAPQALAAGASPREFFLVENRWVPRSVADTPYDPYDPVTGWGGLYFRRDPATGVVLYLAGDRRGVEGLNTGYYDYFLPDGGLLVWHVNMDRIEAGLDDNSINRFGDGLRLVEADGIQDIGVLDAYVLGWYGSARDPFAPWNPAGYGALFVEGAGVPSSRAHDRSWTGVRLWDIADDGQAHGAVMAVKATVEPLQAGWPVELPAGGEPDAPQPRSLDVASLTPLIGADGTLRLAALADARGEEPALVFAWTEAGEPAYPTPPGLPAGAVVALAAAPAGVPAAIPLSDGAAALVLGTVDGDLHARAARADDLAALWTVSVGDTLLAGPQPVPLAGGSWLLLAIDGEGQGHLLDRDGASVGEPLPLLGLGLAQPIAPLRVVHLAAGPAVLICHDNGWRLQPVDAGGFAGGATTWNGRLEEPAQVAVLADAGEHRLLVFGPRGLQGSWRLAPDGAWSLADWPDPQAALVGEPAVADLDGDGRLDVVAATARRIYAWHASGVSLAGFPAEPANLFPLAAGVGATGPLVVADLAGGPGLELAFATDGGHLFVLGDDGRAVAGTPFRFGDGGPAGLIVAPRGRGRASLVLATTGGLVGPPLERRLTGGRVALYDDRPLPAAGPATAAWFGPGGGAARTGPVGIARPVAGQSPAERGRDGVVYYPNPLVGRELTVRFWSATDRPAELAIYNLQGEVVRAVRLATAGESINEHTLDLDVAAGLYVARLTCERTAGQVTSQVKTVAVTR